MNKLISATMLHLVQLVTSGDIVDHITIFVKSVASLDLTGEEKRALVKTQLKQIQGDLGKAISETAGYVLNLAIEVVVAYVNSHK